MNNLNNENHILMEILNIRKIDFEANLYFQFEAWEEKKRISGKYSNPCVRGWWMSKSNDISRAFLDKLHINDKSEISLYLYRGNGHEFIYNAREISIEYFNYLNDKLVMTRINKAVMELI